MSWFWRGFQSAVFYYLSCAPCSTFAHQRKRQKANRRARAEKAALAEASVGIYHHPSPFNTNSYWHEEVVMGPGPPVKRGTKDRGKTDSTRRLNTGGQGSSAGASSADTTLAVSRTSEGPAEEHNVGEVSEGWNIKIYQRPDEVLWGFERLGPPADESVRTPFPPHPSTHNNSMYYMPRNPAVNDFHPPTVSTLPSSPSEIRWMLQPPPTAMVMAGKCPANRSRSVSGGSSAGVQKAGDTTGVDKQSLPLKQGQMAPTDSNALEASRSVIGDKTWSNGTKAKGHELSKERTDNDTTTDGCASSQKHNVPQSIADSTAPRNVLEPLMHRPVLTTTQSDRQNASAKPDDAPLSTALTSAPLRTLEEM